VKLARVKTAGATRLVAVIDGKYLDLAAVDPQIPGCLKALLADAGGLARAQAAVLKAGANGPWVTGELATPIGSPGKVICIGLNYRDHAIESGAPIPEEPICFSKFTTAITGPGCAVPLPSVCSQIDYEAELVVVIGKPGKKIAEAEALSYVAGYMNGNDVSARDWQLHKPGKQWLLGKTPDGFAPIGPWLVTADEVANPHDLAIELTLNGVKMQSSRTKELIFNIPQIIAYLSQIMTLEPGDVIFTGTPPGVGMARKPPVFLKPGDTMDVSIEGLGTLTNHCVAG
jgi:2-keto-4-pentenoate hydratase/2-oxohepta-3-ene-1,7-dioic acid hydratase in catechol pathway